MKTSSKYSKLQILISALFLTCIAITQVTAQCGTAAFVGPDLDGDGVIDTQDLDADNDGILNVDEYNCGVPFTANWGALSNPMASTNHTWDDVDGSGVDITMESDYGAGLDNISTPSTQGGFLSLGMNASDVNDANQFVKFTFTFSEPIIVAEFRIQDIDNESRFTTTSYNDQVLLTVFDENDNPIPLVSNLGASLIEDANGYISDPTGTEPVSFGNTDHWATFTTPILTNKLCVTYDPGDGGGIDNSGDQFISLANIMFCIPADTDGDMIPDYVDLDSDNDGLPDLVEACGDVSLVEEDCRLDSDGSADYPDYNFDGCPDGIVSTYCFEGPVDTDNDGTPDFIDLDSDNDGCNDNVEGGTSELGTSGDDYVAGSVDTDGLLTTGISGVCAYPVNQEYINSFASSACVPPCTYVGDDKDNDGIIDEVDTDSDNDGIPNADEYGCATQSFDLNWNEQSDPAGSMDYDWTDISGSGLGLNLQSTYPSTVDNIGSPSTSSGFLLFGMNASDVNQFDQFSEYIFTFSEPISVQSFRVQDIDNESRFTSTSYSDEVLFEFLDANGNVLPQTVVLGSSLVQLPNGFVTDPTSTEPVSFGTTDNWATYSTTGLVSSIRIVYDPGNGGFTEDPGDQFIALGNVIFCIPTDTDLDGVPDYLDLDSDNDGIPDAIEACGDIEQPLENCSLDDDASAVYPDFNEDGCPDGLVDFYCSDAPVDTDGDGTPDYLDLDSDGDGCSDAMEAGTEELGTNQETYVATTNIDECGLLLSGISGVCPIPSTDMYTDSEVDNCTNPGISVVKSVIQLEDASSQAIGNFDVTYQFLIKNTGNVTLNNISLLDNMQSQIGGAFIRIVGTPTATVGGGNSGYTGTSADAQVLDLTASLPALGSMIVTVVVEIDPNNPTAIVQANGDILNQGFVTGTPVDDDGIPFDDEENPTDSSDSGSDPDGDNPTAPGDQGTPDDPTPVRMPKVAVNKTVVQVVVPGDDSNVNEITMRVKLTNIGNVQLTNLSLVDALDASNNFGQFYIGLTGAPFVSSSNITTLPGLNSGYDGSEFGQDDFLDGMSGLMLPNEYVEIEFTFQIDLSLGNLPDVFTNQAEGSGDFIDPDSGEVTSVTDFSDDGTDPESTNPNSPGDMGTTDDPTPVIVLANGDIGDLVFLDENGDGLQNFGEPGIADVQIVLYDSNDNIIGTTTSDSNGNYLFENVPAGEYYIQFIVPSLNGQEFEPTTPFNGSNTETDSDVNNANGENTTQIFTLSSNQEHLSVDGGFYQCVPFGDYVWFDSNKNSIRDISENGLNGIRVRVYRLESSGYELYDETQTGHKPDTPSDDGYWKFCLPPGSYYVEFAENIQQLVLVQPNRGDEENDSDVTGQYGENTTGSYTLESGQPLCNVGAGYYTEAVIGDQVWLDENLNGIQDNWEPGFEGISLSLYTKDGQYIGTQVTNFDGRYQFNGLREDEYYISVVVPDSLKVTLSNVGSDGLDSDIDNSNGIYTSGCISTVSGGSNITLDIGLFQEQAEDAILSNEWLGFSASHATDHHLIEWSYAKLDIAEKCTVQRRLESETDFVDIATFDSSLFSEWMKYEDYDITTEGDYYYRIAMLNANGKTVYTTIKVLNRTENEQSLTDVIVTPNPVSTQLTLQVSDESNAYDQIRLIDVNGKSQSISTDVLSILNAEKTVRIDVDHLIPGVYFIITSVDGEVKSKKFVKQ